MNVNPINQYFKISAISDMACKNQGLQVSHYGKKFLEWALWEYSQLKMDVSQDVVTHLLDVTDVMTVILPIGTVDYVKVGVPWGQYCITLTLNDKMNKLDRGADPPLSMKDFPPGWLPNGIDVTSYGGGYEFSNYGGRSMYSVGGGFPTVGHFQVRQRPDGCKELLLNNNLPCGLTQVYVETIGIGINACGETIVDPYFGEWLMLKLEHVYEKFPVGRKKNTGEIYRTGQDAWAAETKVRGRVNKMSPADIITISRRAYRLTPHA